MSNEVIIPPDIKPESGEEVTLLDDQTFTFRPQFGRNWCQRNSFGDPRWQFRRTYRGLRMSDRARLHAAMLAAQGSFRTVMLCPAQNPLGTWTSVAGGELFTNSDFSSGTTGWTGINAGIAVSDAVLRMTVSGAGANPLVRQSIALTQYAPHVLRSVIQPGRTFVDGALSFGSTIQDATLSNDAAGTTPGYRLASFVPASAAAANQYAAVVYTSSGYRAGDALDLYFASLSRCFLVDGGGNFLLRSDEIDNATWTKTRASITGAATAPDLSATGDVLTEDSSNNTHYTTQSVNGLSSNAVDYCLTVAARSNGRNFIYLSIDESSGGTVVSQYFNLGTGAVGATGSNGANWTNRRAFIVDLGNSWYQCTLIARKTSGGTTIGSTIGLGSADGTASYLGNGSNGVALWRATLSASSVPSRLRATTTAAVTADTQTGPTLYVKGLPASQPGILVKGDWVEIDGQLKQLTGPLDSDASGMGCLQFRPQVVRALADNTPVVVTKPAGRFMLSESAVWNARFGLYSDFENLLFSEVYE